MTGSQAPALATYKFNKLGCLVNSAYAFTPPANIKDLSNGNVVLSELWLSISNIEFKPTEVAAVGELDGNEVKLVGPYTINLFSNGPNILGSASLDQGSIRRIKYKIKRVIDSASGNPAGMINNSLYLTGSFNSNNFIFKSSEELEFETAGPTSVLFSSGDNILLQLNTAEIIRKINLSSIANGDIISESSKKNFPNPCPAIDPSAADIYTCFVKGIQLQTKLGKDSNGNFTFDSGEATVN